MTTTAQQRDLVEGIVRLTSGLGLQVIAEGIETEEERILAMKGRMHLRSRLPVLPAHDGGEDSTVAAGPRLLGQPRRCA